jgi:hypothetical protein
VNNIRRKDTHVLIAQIQELLELNTAVRKGAEGSFLFELGGDGGIGNAGVSLGNTGQHRRWTLCLVAD